MVVEGNSGEAADMLLETEGKVILVIKWERTWLYCDLVFYGG